MLLLAGIAAAWAFTAPATGAFPRCSLSCVVSFFWRTFALALSPACSQRAPCRMCAYGSGGFAAAKSLFICCNGVQLMWYTFGLCC